MAIIRSISTQVRLNIPPKRVYILFPVMFILPFPKAIATNTLKPYHHPSIHPSLDYSTHLTNMNLQSLFE